VSATPQASAPEAVDAVIVGATLVTMDDKRRVITDGLLAIRGDRIVGVGKRAGLEGRFAARERIDARRFVATPGFIDAHIHITGDPLTRGYVPDDIDGDFAAHLARWVIPRFLAQRPEDERLSAQLAALAMLRSGTTCFLEAGTIRHLDAVVAGLGETGIRGRVGAWVEGRAHDPGEDQTALIDQAIRTLEDEVARYPASASARIGAWPILIGHTTNPDEVWLAAKRLADANGVGVSAHMSPFDADAQWYLANTGRRPVEHLAQLGVLGDNLCLTHLAHIDDREAALLAETRTNALFCPFAALKGAFGVAASGRFPELAAAGVNIALGTDGYASDLMRQIGLAAVLFKDARRDVSVFPATEALAMGTVNGARALRLERLLGSLAPGMKADFVLHDTDRPEWRPLLNVVDQLAWSADGRGVHSTWVDGVRVIDGYRSTRLDEEALYRRAQAAGEALVARSGVPAVRRWPIS
jgi:cytosine/adenosine deaminase-related metal-dependent hydrolase